MDSSVKFVPLLIGLLLAVIMVGAVFVPVVQSSTTQTITTTTENEGAEWLKLGYNEGTDYTFTVGFDGEDNFSVGTQTGEYENLICYADNQRTLFVSGDYWYLLTNGETPSVYQFTDTASVTNASGTLTILDGSETVYTGASPTWAYVPDANGVYGFFTEGGLNLEEDKPKVAVGSYAGVFAYNDAVVCSNGVNDVSLVMSGDYADGEVTWIPTPSELDSLNLTPIDLSGITPIDLGGGSKAGLMSVPTPSYTDGNWGFNLSNGNAVIVSYSGSAGTIVVPSTVSNGGNTYTVTEIGKGGANQTVFNTSLGASTLVFPETLQKINSNAFRGVTGIQGEIIIPDSVTEIGSYSFTGTHISSIKFGSGLTTIGNSAFDDCGFIRGSLIIPDSVTSIGTNVFIDSYFSGDLIIPDSVTSIGTGCFSNKSTFDQVLNLSSVEIDSSIIASAETIQKYVSALGYIAPTLIQETEVVPIDSPVAGLMQMLPLIAGVGALLLAVGTMIYTRF